MSRGRALRGHVVTRRRRITDTGAFFFLRLGGCAVMFLAMATFVTDRERDACAPDCAGRPVTYAAALEWLAFRVMWQEPPGLSAATAFSRSAGLTAEFLLLFTAVIAVVAGVRHARCRQQLHDEHEERMTEMYTRDRVLLVVAIPVGPGRHRMDRGEGDL